MRRKARENSIKFIFEKLVNGSESEITYEVLMEDLSDDAKVYYQTTIAQVNTKFEFLKSTITRYATAYKEDRLYKLDLAIMSVATYEILFTDIPDKVSINEAVEIAKIYSTDNSPTFINGILAVILKNKTELIEEYESTNN
ncbi:MAG: transcription antitermination factor NusB [Clostridiales bacterium]|nr:transcription antitermination factor NusB [Clostridiales bacterium]